LRPEKGENNVALTFWNILSERDVDPPIRIQNLPSLPYEAKQLIARRVSRGLLQKFSTGICSLKAGDKVTLMLSENSWSKRHPESWVGTVDPIMV